jgi:hypothetical protein
MEPVKKDEKDTQRKIAADILKIMQQQQQSAQQKYNAIQELARKYNMPLDKLLKNIIVDWVNEDKEKKFDTKGKNNKIL